MIIKEKDASTEEASKRALEEILQQNLSREKRSLVEKELFALRRGQKGEKDAAYLINFDFGNSKNWAILHDLRLESNGLAAQIDHLLINRFFEFYVLESKNFANGIKIEEDGECLAYYNQRYQAIPSPIEQNRRHIKVLEDCLNAHDIMPKRLGLVIQPRFHNIILMSPKSRVIRPKKEVFNTSMVIKADALRTTIDTILDNMSILGTVATASKLCSSETLREVAEKIASLHQSITIDYTKRFGTRPAHAKVEKAQTNPKVAKKSRYYCWECKSDVSPVVFEYCRSYQHIYGNKVYCKKCQKPFLERSKGRQV
ncbi:nuclease-related domain-containing protein [Desulfurivibrio sp. C05AmB]|jgi:hypothetical protein|uniref:nuclease-related domain-containing protein n=1 Tax=Desulfurivibrio sp. C05AmB TaxID=3374371 RepID=UPI00376F3AE0